MKYLKTKKHNKKTKRGSKFILYTHNGCASQRPFSLIKKAKKGLNVGKCL